MAATESPMAYKSRLYLIRSQIPLGLSSDAMSSTTAGMDVLSSSRVGVLYKPKPLSKNNWIFALCSFIVVLATELYFNPYATLNEVKCLVLTDRRRVAFGKEKVYYLLYGLRLGRKSSQI